MSQRRAFRSGLLLLAVALPSLVLPRTGPAQSANGKMHTLLVGVNETPGKKEIDTGGKAVVSSIGLRLVPIPKGTFTMGSPADEKDRSEDEGPRHEVTISRDLHLGEKEVTQGQFKEVMGYNPSYFSKDGEGGPGLEYDRGKPAEGKDFVTGSTADYPVENVSWDEAVKFCEKLTEKDREGWKIGKGQKYRLPTEAEWEYSCRGGVRSYQTFNVGNSLSSAQANFNGNYPYGRAKEWELPTWAEKRPYLKRTAKVGSYEKNKFGLYDMHGNVWEWCADRYDKEFYSKREGRDPAGPSGGVGRVLRGGGWGSRGGECRSAHRLRLPPGHRFLANGFRVALVPSDE